VNVLQYSSVRYSDTRVRACDASNQTGYGLIFGVHSCIVDTADHITERVEVANVYMNRDIVGTVVGVQPFGGHALSGNDPNYPARFAVEQAISDNVAAVGDDATLLTLNDRKNPEPAYLVVSDRYICRPRVLITLLLE